MIYCVRPTHATPVLATHNVTLRSKYVLVTRPFCDECTRYLCENTIGRELQGTDLGPIDQPIDMGHTDCEVCNEVREEGAR